MNDFIFHKIVFLVFLVLLILLVSLSSSLSAQDFTTDDIIGTWLIEEDGEPVEQIEIYKCDSSYCGRIVWISNIDSTESTALDTKNKDQKLRNRPLLGLEILKDYKFDGQNRWKEGELYAHRKGKTVSPKLTLISEDELKIEIKLLFFKKSFIWKRLLPQ